MIKAALMAYLLDELTTDRLHFVGAPPGTEPPYGVITIISAPREDTHAGGDGVVEARIQIDWFADTDTEATARFEETQTALEGFGFVGVRSGIVVSRCLLDNEYDNYEPDTGLHRKSLDYLIQYEE